MNGQNTTGRFDLKCVKSTIRNEVETFPPAPPDALNTTTT